MHPVLIYLFTMAFLGYIAYRLADSIWAGLTHDHLRLARNWRMRFWETPVQYVVLMTLWSAFLVGVCLMLGWMAYGLLTGQWK